MGRVSHTPRAGLDVNKLGALCKGWGGGGGGREEEKEREGEGEKQGGQTLMHVK